MKTKICILQFFICILFYSNLYSQITHIGNNRAAGDKVGYDGGSGVAGPLDIRNDFATCSTCNIDFYIDSNHFLQVLTGGDLNVVQIGNGYMINDSLVLWHATNTNNIFVGVGAGGTTSGPNTCIGSYAGNGIVGGFANVIIGDDAGLVLGNSGGNTFVGHVAGSSQTSGGENTFIGSLAGTSNISGTGNTYVGSDAGRLCQVGGNNTMMGYSAGYKNLSINNTFLGTSAGYNDTTGRDNTFIGYDACSGNITGQAVTAIGVSAGSSSRLNNNTFLGAGSDVANTTVANATAIGQGAIVPDSNQLILGQRNIFVGIGLSGDNVGPGPQNFLEINADQSSYSYTGAGSGLRFRQLTTSNPTVVNPGEGVLAVDTNGDVIYVDYIGNYCNETPQRPLKGNYEIPLESGSKAFDYYFTGQKDSSADVIVGLPCFNSRPFAKFQSYQLMNQNFSGESNAGLFYNKTNNRISIGAVGISDESSFSNFGLKGYVMEYKGNESYGVLGTTKENCSLINKVNVGVYGYANLWTGGGTPPYPNYAVVGDLGPFCNSCTSGTSTGFGDFAGYFNGDIYTTAGFYQPSDSTLKENVSDITNPMDIINSLNPKAYTFKQQQNLSMILPGGTHYGIFAQEIAAVLPDAVKNVRHPARHDSLGTELYPEINLLAVNTTELIPFLVAAIKEQQQSIEALHAEVMALSGGGNRLGNNGNTEEEGEDNEGETHSIDVQLTNVKAIVLNQNVPNPFAEQTSISYFITDDVKKSQIFFYDNKGTILKIVDINEKGAGQLNVFAADLSSGHYTYTLIADGKVIQTKTMVKQ